MRSLYGCHPPLSLHTHESVATGCKPSGKQSGKEGDFWGAFWLNSGGKRKKLLCNVN